MLHDFVSHDLCWFKIITKIVSFQIYLCEWMMLNERLQKFCNDVIYGTTKLNWLKVKHPHNLSIKILNINVSLWFKLNSNITFYSFSQPLWYISQSQLKFSKRNFSFFFFEQIVNALVHSCNWFLLFPTLSIACHIDHNILGLLVLCSIVLPPQDI